GDGIPRERGSRKEGPPRRQGIRRRVRNGLLMGTTAIGVTEQEDEEQRVDEEHIFYRMVFFLAALTRGLCSRVLGADDPSFRPIMGTRGDSGVATGAATTGADSSSNEPTTEAASASETPSCWARTVRERVGSIAEGAQGRQQCGQQDVNPLVRFALAHAAQAALHHLEAVGLQVREQEEQPVFGSREGAVLVDAKSAGGPGLPIEAPRRHMRLEC